MFQLGKEKEEKRFSQELKLIELDMAKNGLALLLSCKKRRQGSPSRPNITWGEGRVTPRITLSQFITGPTQTDKQPSESTPADSLVVPTLANVSLPFRKPYKVLTC